MSPLKSQIIVWLRNSLACASLLTGITTVSAANGTWNTTTSDLNWSTSANWVGNNVASGTDALANFSTVNISGTTIVNVDQNFTVGTLKLADLTTSSAGIWSIAGTGGILTLATSTGKPTIEGNSMGSNGYNLITSPLAGTQGFEKTGTGRLTVGASGVNNSRLSGEILVTGGFLNIVGSINNSTVKLGAGTVLNVGISGGTGASIGGLNSTGTNGTVSWLANSRILSVTGTDTYSYGGLIDGNTAGLNDVGIEAKLGSGGVQTFTNTGLNYAGGTIMDSGTLKSASASLTGTPFGKGLITMMGGNLVIAPTATAGNIVSYTGVTELYPNASTRTVAAKFTYGAGTLVLDKGLADSLTYTIGLTSAAKDSVLTRATGGTMMIATGGGISTLGTTENFVVNGNSGDSVSTLNGMASAALLGRVSQSDTDADATFLNYGASGKTGFSEATYSASTNINSVAAAFADTRIFRATSATTNALTANASVYSLRADGTTISGAFTLSVGSNSASNPAAGIILNGSSITVTNIAIGDSPLVIYTNAEGGTISSNITASGTTASTAPGVAFTGPGKLTLTGTASTYHSAAINDGIVSITSDAQLGSKSGTSGAGTLTMRNGTLEITGSTDLSNRAITLSGATSSSNGTFSGTEGGTFDIVGAGTAVTYVSNSTTGKVISGTGSFTKKGLGTMTLSGGSANTYSGRTIVTEGTLILNGATGFNMVTSTNNSGDNLALTDVQLIGGELRLGNNNQINDNAKVALAGGTFNLNGRSEGSAAANGVSFLNVFESSTIDFGAGENANILRFSSINLHTDGAVLSIINWDGLALEGGVGERLLFSGSDVTAFTSIFAQDEVSFNGVTGYAAVQFSGYYEIVAVPEPRVVALLILSGLGLMVFRRRRMVA